MSPPGPFQYASLSFQCPVLSLGGGNETARVHQSTCWLGDSVAACCAGAAERADAAHRSTPARSFGRSGISGVARSVFARIAAIGLEHRPKRANRDPLGDEQCRWNSQTRSGVGCARAGRHPWGIDRRAVAADNSDGADRGSGGRRSSRRRLRRQPGAAGRQHHRL